jgi:hypothetical protein
MGHQLSKIKSTILRGRTLKKRKEEEEESIGGGWQEEKMGTQMTEDKKTGYGFFSASRLVFFRKLSHTEMISSRILGFERAVLQNIIFSRIFCSFLHFKRRIFNEETLLLCLKSSV